MSHKCKRQQGKIKCPVCNVMYDIKTTERATIDTFGMCSACYIKKQELVEVYRKQFDGVARKCYMPWDQVYGIISDKTYKHEWSEDPREDMDANYALPRISFCDEYKKWKIEYVGTLCYINDNSPVDLIRYYDTLEQLLKALGVHKGGV